jgi:hypothetical protein
MLVRIDGPCQKTNIPPSTHYTRIPHFLQKRALSALCLLRLRLETPAEAAPTPVLSAAEGPPDVELDSREDLIYYRDSAWRV